MEDNIDKIGNLVSLRENVADILTHCKSKNTIKAYLKDVAKYRYWLSTNYPPKTCFDIVEEQAIAYCSFLDLNGKKTSTIKRAVTSLRQYAVSLGWGNPFSDRITWLLRGIANKRGERPLKRKALTLDMLRRIVLLIPRDIMGVRDKAILLLGFFTAMRRSEICSLDCDSIEVKPRGYQITLRRSKTDQKGAGRLLALPFVDTDLDLCPARALKMYISLLDVKTGPLFRPVGKGGLHSIAFDKSIKSQARLDPQSISRIVKNAVDFAGYDLTLYSAHSLRAGIATALASIGVHDRDIQRVTGHKSIEVLHRYIEEGGLFVDHPILKLFPADNKLLPMLPLKNDLNT